MNVHMFAYSAATLPTSSMYRRVISESMSDAPALIWGVNTNDRMLTEINPACCASCATAMPVRELQNESAMQLTNALHQQSTNSLKSV